MALSRSCSTVLEAMAVDHTTSYGQCLDRTARDEQGEYGEKRRPWIPAKSFTTEENIPDPPNLIQGQRRTPA